MFNIKAIAAAGLAIGTAASAAAQAGIPRVEAAIDYSYMRANAAPGDCGCFSLNGGNAEVAVHLHRNFSAIFSLAGEHAATTSIPGQSLSLLSYTAGPRFSYPLRRSKHIEITPFVEGLVGEVHGFDGQFPERTGALDSSANALAVFVGGGVDIGFSRRFAIRAVQVDYGLNYLPNNANNSENLLRVSTGVVVRLR